MSQKTTSVALTFGLAVASLALPLGNSSAIAQGPPTANQWQGGPYYQGAYDYAGPRGAYGTGLGYIYLPGRGILDSPCGLPTSACTNSQNGQD